MHFYLVNRRQRRIPIDLVNKHLQQMLKERGENWLQEFEGKAGLYKGKAAEIVARAVPGLSPVNSAKTSPLEGDVILILNLATPMRGGLGPQGL